MIFKFKQFTPVIDPSAFIHPQASVTGNVVIGKNVYVGPGARIRGDWGKIIIHDGCNVQENCTIHMFPGITVILGKNAHIGHGAIIHGANIGADCLVGMNAVIMDNVQLGEGCIVGALTLVRADTVVPPRSVIAGNPSKIIKDVSDEMLEWKKQGTLLYQELPSDMKNEWELCEPLTGDPGTGDEKINGYKTWNETKPDQ